MLAVWNAVSALFAAAFVSLPPISFHSGEDWPQWRGPRGDNVARDGGWSPHLAEEPVWRAQIGLGYSSPSIAAGRLVIAGFFSGDEQEADRDRVTCFDAETGSELWSLTYPADIYDNEHGGGTLSTATIVGEVVYLASRAGGVRALNLSDGSIRWEVDLVERHSVVPGRYGFASSPLLHEGRLLLNAGQTVALDPETGETIWISENFEANYATVAPIRLESHGREGLVVFGAKGVVVLDLESGEEIFTYVFRKSERNVEGSTPIVIGERVFVSTAYEHGGALIDFSGPEPAEIWRTRKMRNKMAGCTLYEGFLYGFDESMLKCLDLEGQERWRERGLGHGALSVADGRLLVTSSKGELLIAPATPDGFEVDSRRALIDEGQFWTAPVLSNGRIYVRGSLGDLVCMDQRKAVVASGEALGGSSSTAEAGSLPTPTELVERHRSVTGLTDERVPALRLSGKLHINALGISDSDAVWELRAPRSWHIRFALPPGIGGSIERYYDGEQGWELNPYRGDNWLKEPALREIRRTGGLRTLFHPLGTAKGARTVGTETFGGHSCLRVDIPVAEDVSRSVFFDTGTGRLVGRTAPDEATVIFGDWRPVEKLQIPYLRVAFDPETGQEERWILEEVAFEALGPEAYLVPDSLRPKDEVPADAEESDASDDD